MSNRVVCREASHAGSWYTASGRAPGRPARPPPPPPGPAPGPRGRPPCPARRREGLGRRRPRTAWGGSGLEAGAPPPPPGRQLAGQPGAGRPDAHPGVGREGALPPRAACAVPGDLAGGKNVLPVLLDPSLPLASSGRRGAGGRALPPPGGRCARRPSPAAPTRSRATPCPLAEGGKRPPALCCPPGRRSEARGGGSSESVCTDSAQRPLKGSLPVPPAVQKEAASPPPL